MLPSVATDIFGKSGMNIINALLDNTSFDDEILSNLVLGKLRDKIPDLVKALEGQLSATQADKLRIALDIFHCFNNKVSEIESLIDEKVKPLRPSIELLCSCALVLLFKKLLLKSFWPKSELI